MRPFWPPLAWIRPDEQSAAALDLRERAIHDDVRLICPPTFWYEVANALWVATRRRRLSVDDAAQALDALMDFTIEICETDPVACVLLANEWTLAVYDAAYLVAASASDAHLWSLDVDQARAAASLGITALPVST